MVLPECTVAALSCDQAVVPLLGSSALELRAEGGWQLVGSYPTTRAPRDWLERVGQADVPMSCGHVDNETETKACTSPSILNL